MAGTSSLLRSAQSTRQKIRDYEDALAAYEWNNSTKTYADYVAYEKYLGTQQGSATDPMDQLSYQKKIESARSGYISNEIQRQSIRVIEGGQSNIEKYNRMVDLYYQAADSGQFDLAQSLNLQLDNLSVTIQNDQRAALSSNREAANEMAKNIKNMVSDAEEQVKGNASAVLAEYSKLGPEQFQADYGSDIFSLLSNMINSQDPNNPGLVQVYQQAAEMTPDASDIRGFQTKLNGLANGEGTGIELPGVGKVSYKDLADQAYAQSIGQSLFDTVQTAKGTEFTKNKTTGYAWGRDENGEYKLMPIYNAKQNFTSGVADSKKKDQNLSYDTVLKNNGFDVVQSGDSLIVRNNGEFDTAGIPRGQQVQLYMDLNGNLQFVNGDKAYSLGFDQKTGGFSGVKAEMPNPINLLPSGNQRSSSFNNRFFAGKDLSNLPAGTVGLIDTTSPIARGMEAGPRARPQPVLQAAAGLPQPQPITPQSTAPGAAIQNAVNPLTLPGNAKLTIAKPQPLPKITIAKPQPLPNISVVQQPQPQPRINVGVASPSGGTLRVGY